MRSASARIGQQMIWMIATSVILSMSRAAHAQSLSYETIGLTDEQVPGLPVDTVYKGFGPGLFNDDGDIVFVADVGCHGPSSPSDFGILAVRNADGEVQVLAQEGQQVPGFQTGVIFDTLGFFPSLNNAGDVLLSVRLSGPGITPDNEDAILIAQAGAGLVLAVQAADALAVLPNGITGASLPSVQVRLPFTEQGVTAWSSRLVGASVDTTNDAAVLQYSTSAGVNVVARKGDFAAGIPTRRYGDFSSPFVAEDDQISVASTILSNDGSTVVGSAVHIEQAGQGLTSLIATGDQAPGFGAGVEFVGLTSSTVSHNAAGTVAFRAGVSGNGVSETVLYTGGRTTPLEIVAQTGAVAGDLGSGVVYSSFDSTRPEVNDSGEVAFASGISGPGASNNAIFVWTPGRGASAVLQDGTPAPYISPGAIYLGTDGTRITFGNAGFVALPMIIIDGADLFFALGIVDTDGGVWSAAFEGELFDVDDSSIGMDFREVSEVVAATFGIDDLDQSDEGQVSFRLRFTDGTDGLFVAIVDDPCLADTNDDGSVTPADFNAWIIAFNTHAPECDQNGDGNCTPADFNGWILNFNAGCP